MPSQLSELFMADLPPMTSKPINDGLLMRSLIMTAYRARTHKFLRGIWSKPQGLPTIGKYCIKCAAYDDLAEASTMVFMAKNTSIPVPKVYSAFIHKGRTYILMSKIEGQSASLGWADRSADSKARILGQLRSIVNELRAIAPPAGVRVSNVDDGPIRDPRLPHDIYWGPFDSTRKFHEALFAGKSVTTRYEGMKEDVARLQEFYRDAPEGLVFTHGDLSSLNIMVKGDDVTGIVDWETAGWLPTYWEYSMAWHVNPYNTFWQEEVDKFMTPLPYELDMDKIRQKYFGPFGVQGA